MISAGEWIDYPQMAKKWRFKNVEISSTMPAICIDSKHLRHILCCFYQIGAVRWIVPKLLNMCLLARVMYSKNNFFWT